MVDQIIKCRNIKAYPSVNSPNDGDFHAEQNSKWFVNSIATKPFVIGKTKKDVHDAFGVVGRTEDESNSIQIKNGMFSIAGYIFKMAENNVSDFDTAVSSTDFVTVDSRQTRNYVFDLCGYGSDTSLTTDTDVFLFTEYNPQNLYLNGDIQYPEDAYAYIQSLSNACLTKACIGYIVCVHKGEFHDKLTIASNYVQYGNNRIYKTNASGITISSTADEIRTAIGSVNVGKSYYVSSDSNSVICIYPVYIVSDDLGDTFQFTDIFSNTYRFKETSIHSKPYPYTQNDLTEIDSNAPLDGVGFTDCSLTTLSGNSYDFTMLYDNGDRAAYPPYMAQYTKALPAGFDLDDIVDPDTAQALFVKKTMSQLVNNVSATATELNVDNDLSYYCLNLPDNLLNPVLNKQGQTVRIPVAFMKSNGELCTDSFDETDVAAPYPVESYVHFIYRQCGVEQGDLAALTSSASFSTTYNTYLAKPMSVYLHLCYNSLFDKVVHAAGATDSANIKSSGCGIALSGVSDSHISDDDFNTYLNYAHTAYTLGETGLVATTENTQLSYPKDRTSDKFKIANVHTFNEGSLLDAAEYGETSIKWFTYYPKTELTTTVGATPDVDATPILVEDPAYFLCNGHKYSGSASVANVKLYYIKVSGSVVTVYNSGIDFLPDDGQASITGGVIDYLNIDETLMPGFDMIPTPAMSQKPVLFLDAHKDSITVPHNNTPANTMKHGIELGFDTYAWQVSVATYAKPIYDAEGYLAGSSFLHPEDYLGLALNPDYKDEKDSLLLYSMSAICAATNMSNGCESTVLVTDDSEYTQRRKESIIHVSKIYGDDYKSIEQMIQEQASGIDPETIAELVALITELQNIIGLPYNISIKNTISYRLDALEDADDAIRGRLDVLEGNDTDIANRVLNLEVAVGMPYDQSKGAIENRLDAIENQLLDMTTSLLNISIGTVTQTQVKDGTTLYVDVRDFVPSNVVFIPAQTTLVCRIPLTRWVSKQIVAPMSVTSIGNVVQLSRDSSAQAQIGIDEGYITPNNIDFYYAQSQSLDFDEHDEYDNIIVFLMYIRNNNDEQFHFNGTYGLKINGPLRYKPNTDHDLFDLDGITYEFVANEDLPMKDTTYYDSNQD